MYSKILINRILRTYLTCFMLTLPSLASAKTTQGIPKAITTPDKLETRLGPLEFNDGAPKKETVEKIYNYLDFMHGKEVFLNSFRGASMFAIRKGLISAGVKDNDVIIFSELMDSKSLFLTANADTIYFVSFIDLTKGPMVVETPPLSLGIFDDMWFRWIIDFGLPGPDRGAGGKYLIFPPGYKGDQPDGGFHVAHSRTTRVLMIGRAFLVNHDPKEPVELIKKTLKIYPYRPGGFGTSIATALEGKVPLLRTTDGNIDWKFLKPQKTPQFIEGTGMVMNTIPPNNFSYFEIINELVQQEPANAMDPEIMGSLAAVGIVKGKPFKPDLRMQKILTDAVNAGNATARVLLFNPRESEEFYYYPGSAWQNSLWIGGYDFETPPSQIDQQGLCKPSPPTYARTLNSRTAWFYYATGVTPSMIMHLPEIGSQYIWAFTDAGKDYLDGSKTYKVTLPKDIPAEKFWSLTVYDNQTRSMLQTSQRFPRAGSQNYPTPAAVPELDGSTIVYFSPNKPEGVKDSNWIQTVPNKGFNVMLRLYSPLEPFFTKVWRPSEIELVN